MRKLTVLMILIIAAPAVYADTPTDADLLELEQQIKQQEAEQEKARQRAAEEARRRAEEQKLREEQARLEEERRRLEEERQKIEAARQAEIERKSKEEEARKLAIEEQKRREEEAKKALVTLVFYRDQSFPFDGDSAIITHNGKEIGRLSSKSYFIYQTPPGEQIFKAVIFGDWTTEKAFELEPRSTQFIMTAIDWTTVGFSMQAAGPEVIARLENTGSLDPRRFFGNFDEVVNSSRQSSQSSGSTIIGR